MVMKYLHHGRRPSCAPNSRSQLRSPIYNHSAKTSQQRILFRQSIPSTEPQPDRLLRKNFYKISDSLTSVCLNAETFNQKKKITKNYDNATYYDGLCNGVDNNKAVGARWLAHSAWPHIQFGPNAFGITIKFLTKYYSLFSIDM